jgi:hypothetical protein
MEGVISRGIQQFSRTSIASDEQMAASGQVFLVQAIKVHMAAAAWLHSFLCSALGADGWLHAPPHPPPSETAPVLTEYEVGLDPQRVCTLWSKDSAVRVPRIERFVGRPAPRLYRLSDGEMIILFITFIFFNDVRIT